MAEQHPDATFETTRVSLLERRAVLQQRYDYLAAAQSREHGKTALHEPEALTGLHLALQIMGEVEDELHRQNQQLALQRAECESQRKRYRELYEFCPDAYFVTDFKGVILEANEAASTITGRRVCDLIGMELAQLVSPDGRDVLARYMDDLQREGRIHGYSARMNVKGGEDVPVALAAVVCADGEGNDEIRWLARDMTLSEQTQAELLQMRDEMQRCERLAAIGTLAAGLGHDVKNLLFPMRRRLDSLAAVDLPQRAVEDVKGLRHVVTYLQQLASNLQLMAERPDMSQSVQGTTDVVTWWEHVAPLVRTATRSSIELRSQFVDDLPPLNIAPHLLTQAVMNLVSNAGDVMTNGGQITIWAKRTKHGPFVKVGVTDNGPGMAPETLRRALDPFFTTKPRSSGLSTGMGLSLVRSIVKSVAGSVRIDSAPDRGTTVILRLPIAPEPAQSTRQWTGNTPCAAVSVSDSHLAATICTLLNLSRLPSWRCDPQDPGECNLWIAEPETIEAATAREFLRNDSKRLVLYGRRNDHWQDLKAVWIDPSASLADLRDTLSEIAFEVLQRP